MGDGTGTKIPPKFVYKVEIKGKELMKGVWAVSSHQEMKMRGGDVFHVVSKQHRSLFRWESLSSASYP